MKSAIRGRAGKAYVLLKVIMLKVARIEDGMVMRGSCNSNFM